MITFTKGFDGGTIALMIDIGDRFYLFVEKRWQGVRFHKSNRFGWFLRVGFLTFHWGEPE